MDERKFNLLAEFASFEVSRDDGTRSAILPGCPDFLEDLVLKHRETFHHVTVVFRDGMKIEVWANY